MSCNAPFLSDRLVALERQLAEHIHMKRGTLNISRSGLFSESIIKEDMKKIDSCIAFVKTELAALAKCAPRSKA
jgi:hypothetical protein